ncbi:MAG: transposase [bacterium]
MARIDRYKQHYKNAIYHIFNRGVNKEKIFMEENDYIFYLKKIKQYKEKYGVEFISYALLPNHFHYIIRQTTDDIPLAGARGDSHIKGDCHRKQSCDKSPISKFMHALHTSYAFYFNKKYKKVGHLFQDRYKQRIVEEEKYLIWLSSYVNGNAKIHKIADNLKDWKFSSYLDYAGLRNGILCNKELVTSYFESPEKYAEAIEEAVELSRERKDALADMEIG